VRAVHVIVIIMIIVIIGPPQRTLADALVKGNERTRVFLTSISLGGQAVPRIGAMWSVMTSKATSLSSYGTATPHQIRCR
jgi:hypothetical protein